MAEFQEVIKHWGRMLDAHRHGESIAIEASVPADAFKDAKLVEEIVMAWAAEHPEPVYPAWRDWLRDLYGNPQMTMTDILESPIDPEIAKRLNIVPRRARNGENQEN